MSRRGWVLFTVMGAIWGVPYLLIKVADGGVSVTVLVFARVFAGSLLLLPIAIRHGRLRALRPYLRWVAAFAAVEVILPWLLLSSAETHLSSSLSGLLIAAVPVIGVGVARLAGDRERLSATRWAGLGLGLAGVALLGAISRRRRGLPRRLQHRLLNNGTSRHRAPDTRGVSGALCHGYPGHRTTPRPVPAEDWNELTSSAALNRVPAAPTVALPVRGSPARDPGTSRAHGMPCRGPAKWCWCPPGSCGLEVTARVRRRRPGRAGRARLGPVAAGFPQVGARVRGPGRRHRSRADNPVLVGPAATFSATTMAVGIVVTFLPLAVTRTPGDVATLALLLQPATAIVGRWLAGGAATGAGPPRCSRRACSSPRRGC